MTAVHDCDVSSCQDEADFEVEFTDAFDAPLPTPVVRYCSRHALPYRQGKGSAPARISRLAKPRRGQTEEVLWDE